MEYNTKKKELTDWEKVLAIWNSKNGKHCWFSRKFKSKWGLMPPVSVHGKRGW